jgi:hypothetical protein
VVCLCKLVIQGWLLKLTSFHLIRIVNPFDGDQPATAKHLTQNLKVAVELYETKTAIIGKPIFETGRSPAGTREAVAKEIREVIKKCRGAEGRELRRNVEKVKRSLSNAWKSDGPAKLELDKFVEMYLSN